MSHTTFFQKYFSIVIVDEKGMEHYLKVEKRYKIQTGFFYRLYVKPSISNEYNISTQSLLGIEVIHKKET